MGSTTENSALGVTCNPLDVTRVPGGSSGGSAAAVAAHFAAFALGSDTGGSARLPAAYCGVVGLRPTRGAVSRYGLVGFAPSMDTVAPITRTVRDNAAVFAAIAGADPRDATANTPVWGDFKEDLEQGVAGLVLALPREALVGLSPDVRAALDCAVAQLEDLGARVELVDCAVLSHALSAYYVLSSAEASSTLARFDGVRFGARAACEDMPSLYRKSRSEGLGDEVGRRILLGTYVLSAGYYDRYYKKARAAAEQLKAALGALLERFDAILTPTALTVAPRMEKERDRVALYRGDALTVPAALAGLPALSFPFGKGEAGMPVGLQLTGALLAEGMLYRIAAALEESGVTV
jgi:aspartyl-tRNA(Asn)/glutamyl-tRNA(Gln) amidotransferase subunit A